MSYVAEKSLGLKLPRQSKDIAKEGTSVNRSELRKGDLVFFNTLKRTFSHVGIYIGNNQFVHAPSSGGSTSCGNWPRSSRPGRTPTATRSCVGGAAI